MSLFSSVMDTVSGKDGTNTEANPFIGVLGGLLTQSGGLQGLMNKFSQAGLGNVFSSWVSNGPNPPISGEQLQRVLGSEQVKALGAKFGVDPAQVSQALAEHLPTIVDKLTPGGKIDNSVNVQQQLSSMLPSLLQSFSPAVTAGAPA